MTTLIWFGILPTHSVGYETNNRRLFVRGVWRIFNCLAVAVGKVAIEAVTSYDTIPRAERAVWWCNPPEELVRCNDGQKCVAMRRIA